MTLAENPINILIHELSKLPGVGEKTAMRLALHILRQPRDYGQRLARALEETVAKVRFCANCQNITTEKICDICASPKRDRTTICVVEDVADLKAIEKSQCYRGYYHCLHGSLSPVDGIGPEELKIGELVQRLTTQIETREIILATNPNVNGDATALYLSKTLKPFDKKITRLATGIPIGGHLEFIDQNTIARAMEGRRVY
ncbi:MAG: recombination protein RecR [Deltaproteobacteria bacterium]|nr:recombination protein RecR [Deltaproteobacteria bacterium]